MNLTIDEKISALVEAELASGRRWLHRITLVAASIMLAIIVALWVSEPRPLLLRLHISFALMSAIALGWILVLANILLRKNCPTVGDRIATAWMSVVGSGSFAIASLAISWMRGEMMAMLTLAIVSGGLLTMAVVHLRDAYRQRERLRRRLSQLDG